MNQFDIILMAVAYVRKGKMDMSYQGEHQTLTKQRRNHQYPNHSVLTMHTLLSYHILVTNYARLYKSKPWENLCEHIASKISSFPPDQLPPPNYFKW